MQILVIIVDSGKAILLCNLSNKTVFPFFIYFLFFLQSSSILCFSVTSLLFLSSTFPATDDECIKMCQIQFWKWRWQNDSLEMKFCIFTAPKKVQFWSSLNPRRSFLFVYILLKSFLSWLLSNFHQKLNQKFNQEIYIRK